MKRSFAIVVPALLMILFTTGVLWGVQRSATLGGRVTDPQGRSVADAEVSVVQKATSILRSARSGEQGRFVISELAPGDYEVRVAATGFARKTYPSVILQVGQAADLEIQLALSTLQQQITLEAQAQTPLVNTVSSVVDGVIMATAIENLPLNGRNFLELALLVPGNSPAPNFDPTKTNTVAISSAGQLGRGGNVTIDGADNNDDVVGGTLQNISQEAVQEFQIATNRFSAEIGRSGSSVINVVTRSGSNELHGSASFFLRDDHLQGLPATFDRRNPKPPFDREQFSASMGGPLIHDKAWWFGSFEYRNQDGAVLVGRRDAATRTIQRDFATAPLNDLMGTLRGDWKASGRDQFSLRYSIQREDDVAASTLIRAIGSASQRQAAENNFQSFLANWTAALSSTAVNSLSFSVNNFINRTVPVQKGPQLTFPSLQDGASFRVPQQTRQNRIQFGDVFTMTHGAHTLRFGGEVQRIDADFDLGVFQDGRIELVQDFATFDHNGDGTIDDDDLLFAVTLRSGVPERALIIPNADNNHISVFVQNEWRVHPRLSLNIGLRYELDTDVKNVGRYDELNPLVTPFLPGNRSSDRNNWAPRFGFNWATPSGHTSVHGGYGIYYDRVTLEIQSLERGLDGRALPIEVRAGNAFFVDPATGQFPAFAPRLSNPFTGFILPGAGAGGINIIDNRLQNPSVQQFNLGIQQEVAGDFALRADFVHNLGTHFIIGRTIGTVFNPVVGGPDRVVNLESSVNTKYDGLLVSLERRFARGHHFRASYTLSKSFNYANDDQIPFAIGPVDPAHLNLEYGPTPNDQRHRFAFSGLFDLPGGISLSTILTAASAVPMDILLPDASSRIPVLQRNAGGRLFKTGAELNEALRAINSQGGISGQPLPLVSEGARFGDSFHSVDLRITRPIRIREHVAVQPMVEVFNLFNVTNVLGVSNVNYSGFSNALVRDSDDPTNPGFLSSSRFGQPVTTAGGVFGSGGPRAFQFALRVQF
jgi:hypothetical protein